MRLSIKFPIFGVVLGLLLLAASSPAKAQTLEAELGRVDKLRKTFGDEFISGLTNLPPKNYKIARDQALAMADQIANGSLAREEAKKSLCASFEKNGGTGCPALAVEVASIPDSPSNSSNDDNSEINVSAVSKTTPEPIELQGTEADLLEAPELAGGPVAADSHAAPSVSPSQAQEEPNLDEPAKESAGAEPELNAAPTDHVSVPQHRRALEPQLESENPELEPTREVSSEPVVLSPVVE